MIDPVSLAISAGSFVVSAETAWLTLFRSGKLKMTRPTLFYFGPDGTPTSDGQGGKAKVFLRTFLYATSKRGKLIENMFVVVSRHGITQPFNIWIYREEGRLSRGSGLHVDQEGRALDHNFLIPPDNSDFKFLGGDFTLKVYAKIVGVERPKMLQEVSGQLPDSVAREAITSGRGAFFDWAPDLGRYYVDSRPPPTQPDASLAVGMRAKALPESSF
jgi:hypothetical protein